VKKVFPILMAFIIFVLPFGGLKAFAFEVGLLDGKNMYLGSTAFTDLSNPTAVLTDNDANTSLALNSNAGSIFYNFNSPVSINAYELSQGVNGSLVIKALTFGGQTVILSSSPDKTGVKTTVATVDDVKTIYIVNTDSNFTASVKEFDVFGTDGVPIIHDEISNLITTVNNNNVTLTYDFPSSNSDFTGSKIYRNGSLISTQNNLSGSFVDSGLSYDTSYSYKVTATYSDSFETAGVIDSVVIGSLPTDPASIPPSNVTSLMVSGLTGSGATLNWSNSSDIDLASVNIYLNGLVVTNIPLTSSYVLTGLTGSTQYNYGVALVDNDGNVSSIVSTVFTTLAYSDTVPPVQVTGVSVDSGNSALYVKWSANTDSDLSGYNVYIGGVKFNTAVIKNKFLTVTDLVNDQSYDVQVSAVDLSGNEGAKSSISSGIPLASKLPLISMDYTLSDVADAVSSWFASQWLILAFAISIPLSFYIASRVKLLFLD
jgi:hypothetical protein